MRANFKIRNLLTLLHTALGLVMLLSSLFSSKCEANSKVNLNNSTKFQKYIGKKLAVRGWISPSGNCLLIWLDDRKNGIVINDISEENDRTITTDFKKSKKLDALLKRYPSYIVTACGTLFHSQMHCSDSCVEFDKNRRGYFYFLVDDLKINSIVDTVYVIKKIPKGSFVKADQIELKKMEPGNLNFPLVKNVQTAIGRKAKFDIDAGQILLESDLNKRIPSSKF